jgi:PKD repeat protein
MTKQLPVLAVILLACILIAGCQQPNPVAPAEVSITGPASIEPGQMVTFVAAVGPMTTTVPLTYLWEATAATPISATSGLTGTANFSWTEPGEHTVTLTVSNPAGKANHTYQVVVAMPPPTDPLEAYEAITDKQKEVKSSHIEATADLKIKLDGFSTANSGEAAQMFAVFKNFKAKGQVSGDVDAVSGDFGLKGELDLGVLTPFVAAGEDVLRFEVIKKGNQLYAKSSADESWNIQDVSAATGSNEKEFALGQKIITNMVRDSAQVERLADEEIDDMAMYHYLVTVDLPALLETIENLAQLGGPANDELAQFRQVTQLLKDSTLEIETWAGKSDLIPRRTKVTLKINLQDIPEQPGATGIVEFVFDNQISQIDEPVTITAPK